MRRRGVWAQRFLAPSRKALSLWFDGHRVMAAAGMQADGLLTTARVGQTPPGPGGRKTVELRCQVRWLQSASVGRALRS